MKALSIKQPWAYLIAAGIKDIENRTWKTNYRGKFLIHASRKEDVSAYIFNEKVYEYFKNKKNYSLYYSSIIGECEIIDCIQDSTSIWAEPGCWHFVLTNSVLYDKPILNVKGALNFWNYEEKIFTENKTDPCENCSGLCRGPDGFSDCAHYGKGGEK